MLTTIDNPYSPRDDYSKWLQWDQDNHYYTSELLASFMPDNINDLDDSDFKNIYDSVVNEIMQTDVLDVYKII